jgi:hypothetical protein
MNQQLSKEVSDILTRLDKLCARTMVVNDYEDQEAAQLIEMVRHKLRLPLDQEKPIIQR